jgi:murein DD-endopeptidase MepM/ murein hydrolase activator NlpD
VAAGQSESSDAQLQAIRRRLAEMRKEIAGWSELHAKIWRPLGPDTPGVRAAAGVGGAANALAAPAPPSIDAQLSRIAESLAEERQRLQALAKFMAGPGSMLRAMPSHWPLRGAVNSEFGRRSSPWSDGTEFHEGIDIAARPGTLVKAPAPGTVRFAGHSPGYGMTVILDHGRDVQSRFGHLREIAVSSGQHVERGQAIAKSGETGRVTGPHLHYEILVNGRAVNPRGYLWE